MAALQDPDRQDICAEIQRDSRLGTLPNMVKTDLKALIDAVDDWIVANANSFNNALPVVARTNLSVSQKAFVFMVVLVKRYGKGA